MGGVKSADSVTGPYDLVVAVEVADLDAVGSVVKQIHSVPGICKTTTCVGVKYS
ncbi:MAG: Lrp/AsnC family transcriptional regulator [Dehalococcoidia bacterium]|nr:MAG: Lrp/AsnC family transcriptional regulator [Dehalococcoidia bacterium]